MYREISILVKLDEVDILIVLVTVISTSEIISKIDVNKKFSNELCIYRNEVFFKIS